MTKRPSGAIKMYSVNWCGFCRAAIKFFADKGLSYEHIDLTGKDREMAKVKAESGWSTMPIIFIGDTLVGGFSDLAKLDQEHPLEYLKA